MRLFDDIGMDLFQEKQGFMWRNSGAPIPPPGRLRFASVLVTGRDLYRDVMARAGRDTLDRKTVGTATTWTRRTGRPR